MTRRKTEEQIRHLLRLIKRDLARGLTIFDACRRHGVIEKTYYRWRDRFDPDEQQDVRRLRHLQAEVERLKLLVAELMLDKQILQEAAKKKW
jgi:putative transposase